jgi:AAA family ATP:ADP antiporter
VQKIFESLFNIRPGEFRLVQSFFLYYVCIGMFIIVGITVGDALFLTHVGQEKVNSLYAWMHVGIAVITVVVTWMYGRVIGLLSRIVLLVGMQSILLLSILVFRQLIPSGDAQANEWLYFGLVLWLRVCGRLLMMVFFSFAGDYFTVHDAKRLYGYIAGGLAVGIIVAGTIIRPVVSVISSENMLYLCVGFLAIGMGFSLFIHKTGTPVTQLETSSDTGTKKKVSLKVIISQQYIQLAFLVVLLGLICFVIVDVQMKLSAKNTYPNSTDLAVFFGYYYTYVGMLEILFQFLVVEFLLRQVGIINCLIILPCIHIIMGVLFYSTGYGFLSDQTLFIIATASCFQDILSDSLDLPSRELLFLPLPSPIRVRAQAMMSGMIVPIGKGIGGLLVIGLIAFDIPLFQYSLFVVFFALVRVAILFLERPSYRETLVSSLKNNQLDTTELRDMVQESGMDFVLEELLRSDEEQIVNFSLDLLQNRSLGGLSTQLRKLALGVNPVIAIKAVEVLGADGGVGHLDTIEQALKSKLDSVREAAVLAFCQIKKEEALGRVRQWLDAPDQVIRHAVLVGCGRYCGQAGVELTQPILKQMISGHTPEERIAAARLLRDMRNTLNASLVENLLYDSDITVRIAAVEACGTIRSSTLMPHLLHLYKSLEMRMPVFNVLEHMPEDCIPAISEAVFDPHLDEASRDMLIQAFASIGGKSAQKALWEFFCRDFPLLIRVAAGSALRRIATHNQLQELNENEFDTRLKFLCENIRLLNRACQEIRDWDSFAWQLINDHTQLEIECLFQLLGFKYNVHQVEKVRYNFFNSNRVQRANALELLDNILPRRIAPGVVQLLDSYLDERTPEGKGLSEDTVQQLMKTEAWLRVVTTYHLSSGTFDQGVQAEKALTDREREVYSLLARISFLKKVPLFKDVPGNYLVPLAKIAHPVNLKGGETLFYQGDRGDAMYLICRGSISVQVHGVELIRRGIGDCIGEMAILDGAPRSASCVAAEDTELLKILDSDFATIIKGQTSVALAVLRTLAGRLRQQTAHPMKQKRTGSIDPPEEKSPTQQFMTKETELRMGTTYYPSGETFESEAQTGELLTERERGLYNLLERISFLKKVPLFKDIPENYLIPLAKIAHSLKLKGGETLFHQGDRGDAMYLICRGSISVQVHGVELIRRGVGDYIGEMALLDGAPRSAACVAKEDTELLKISDSDFETVMRSQTSVVLAMLQTLVQRLRQQTANPMNQEVGRIER